MAWTFQKPAYPQELTAHWWQSHKGTIAKIATRNDGTGIGQRLTALEAEFKKIDWNTINVMQKMPGPLGSRSHQDIQQGIANAKKAAQDAQACYRLARDLEREAKNLATEWSQSKVIPKSSTAAATTISQKAKELSYVVALGSLSEIVDKGLKEEADAAQKQRDILAKILGSIPDKLDALVKNARAGVTVQNWPRFWSNDVRLVGTQFGVILKAFPNARADVQALRVHASTCKTPSDQQQLNRWLAEIANAAASMRRKMP